MFNFTVSWWMFGTPLVLQLGCGLNFTQHSYGETPVMLLWWSPESPSYMGQKSRCPKGRTIFFWPCLICRTGCKVRRLGRKPNFSFLEYPQKSKQCAVHIPTGLQLLEVYFSIYLGKSMDVGGDSQVNSDDKVLEPGLSSCLKERLGRSAAGTKCWTVECLLQIPCISLVNAIDWHFNLNKWDSVGNQKLLNNCGVFFLNHSFNMFQPMSVPPRTGHLARAAFRSPCGERAFWSYRALPAARRFGRQGRFGIIYSNPKKMCKIPPRHFL